MATADQLAPTVAEDSFKPVSRLLGVKGLFEPELMIEMADSGRLTAMFQQRPIMGSLRRALVPEHRSE